MPVMLIPIVTSEFIIMFFAGTPDGKSIAKRKAAMDAGKEVKRRKNNSEE